MKAHRPCKQRQPASPRTRELACIHIAASQLQLDDDTYRALLHRVTGQRSAKDLDAAARQAVISEMTRLGARIEQRQQRPRPGKPKRIARGSMMAKVEALLADATRPWEYAHSMARRMFGVTRVEWLRDDQLHKLVAALMIDQRRHQA